MRLSRKNKKQLAQFKRRTSFARGFRPLIWGTSGLRCLSRVMLPRRRLGWIKTWIKWHYRVHLKRYTYNRYRYIKKRQHKYYWMRLRHTMPCTRKASKARMGKGKGEIKGWFGNMRPGFFILEFKTARFILVKRLLAYLVKKFTGRVQGVIKSSWRETAGFGGSLPWRGYFENRAFLTYKRKRFLDTRRVGVQPKQELQKTK